MACGEIVYQDGKVIKHFRLGNFSTSRMDLRPVRRGMTFDCRRWLPVAKVFPSLEEDDD